MDRLSDFFSPSPGGKKGVCVLCGRVTDEGHPVKFSSNFTAWSLLGAGECICERCYTLVSEQAYRRKSWVATADGIKFLMRKDVLPALLEPPKPPFAVYVTKTGKKQGFLQLMNRVSTSRDEYYVAFEDSLILVDRKKLEEMVNVAREARKLKFTKADLVTPSVKKWEHEELCRRILRNKGNPLWEVVVYAVD